MIKATIGTETGNRAAKDGRIGKVMSAMMEKLRLEAAYFAPLGGKRCAFFFFDMSDSAQLPPIAEQLFQELDADVEFTPVMNAEELKKGLAAMPHK